MCEKIENGFEWQLDYFGLKIYLSENSLLSISKTLNFNSLVKVFQRLNFNNFFCLVSLITGKIMCDKIRDGLGWKPQYLVFQIYLRLNSLFIMGKTLKLTSLLKVF